jgi:hypothetical protein
MSILAGRPGIAPRALTFTILCAVWTGDIIGSDREEKPPMVWEHVDFEDSVWIIPSTKTELEHSVPLSDASTFLCRWLTPAGSQRKWLASSSLG